MRIGIFGTGSMADALGTQWARAGHELMVSGRDRAKADALAKQLGARSGTWQETADFGEAILLALPAERVPDLLGPVDALRDKVIVDCTNWLLPGTTTPAGAMAERIAALKPEAHVVKAFNLAHVDVWRMTPPVFGGRPLAVPLCGDDRGALDAVRVLVRDLGATPVDGGGLARAALLEATAAFVIGLWVAGEDAQAILAAVQGS